MSVARRIVLDWLAGAAAVALGTGALAAPRGRRKPARQLPAFEIQGPADWLAGLATDIAGYSVEGAGATAFAVWLKGKDGSLRRLGVDEREPLPMFEIFGLRISTLAELEALWLAWKPSRLAGDLPEPFRTLLSTRPPKPAAPAAFEPWPFHRWRTQVLRRAEFIDEGPSVGKAVGRHPNLQSAARPGQVPSEADAVCEVAVGLLFTGAGGERLLIGVDWTPETMLVTDAAARIDDYLALCEAVDLDAYLARLGRRG